MSVWLDVSCMLAGCAVVLIVNLYNIFVCGCELCDVGVGYQVTFLSFQLNEAYH